MEFQAERITNPTPQHLMGAMHALLGVGKYVHQSGLEPSLISLVEIRASQINGCAACLDMHVKDALAAGENEQRLFLLPAWRETPFFTDRERAALAWTEAVTLIADDRVPDEVYEEVRPRFSDDELISLTMAVVAINGFNRLNIAFRTVPGRYQAGDAAKMLSGAGAAAGVAARR